MKEERSIGALVMALVTLGILAGAYVSPWFEYDYSTVRQVAPDGPYEETGVETDHLDFYVTHTEGDVEPGDAELAQKWSTWTLYSLYIAGAAMLIVILGEIPFVARIFVRPVGLTVTAIGLAGVITMATLSYLWLPEIMASYGVTEPYTAHRIPQEGYVHSTMSMGWYAMMVAIGALFGTGLFKFQAGADDPDVVAQHAVEAA